MTIYKKQVYKSTVPFFQKNASEWLSFYDTHDLTNIDWTTPGKPLQTTKEIKRVKCIVVTSAYSSTYTSNGHQADVDSVVVRSLDSELCGLAFKRFNVWYRVKSILNTEGEKKHGVFYYHYVAKRGK